MMGLLAAMLGKGARLRTLAHDLSHAPAQDPNKTEKRIARSAYAVPGPPPVPQWNSAQAPLPDLFVVEAGMRPITGGRRRSF
jgi:hypothetical protein